MQSSTSSTNRVRVNSAYSSQASTALPNPLLLKAIEYIRRSRFGTQFGKLTVADQGCGKLRHLRILRRHFPTIYLVDTNFQLDRRQRLFGFDNITIREYVARLDPRGRNLKALSNLEFESTKLELDVVINACVLDVELPRARQAMFRAAHSNLKRSGLFVVIVPRNDRSILVRCLPSNKYLDGYVFKHHGTATFYRNFHDARELTNGLAQHGFDLVADLSAYRQICLISSER